MTTTIVFGDESDGAIRSGEVGQSYAAARAGVGLVVNTTGTSLASTIGPGQRVTSGIYQCAEAFIAFDLDAAGIPSGDSIIDVDLTLNQALSVFASDPFDIEARAYDWGPSLGTDDWVPGANLGSLDQLAVYEYASGTGLRTFTPSGSALIDHVEAYRDGVSRMLLHSSRHRLGDVPSGSEYAVFSSANASGTTNDPRLVIEHVAAPATTIVFAEEPAGYITSSDSNYNTARAGSGLGVSTAGTLTVGQLTFTSYFFIYQAFIAFDVGAANLGDGEIFDADLVLFQQSGQVAAAFDVEAREYDWGPTLTIDDWVPGGPDLGSLDLLATLVATTDSNTTKTFTPSGTALLDHVEAHRDGVSRMLLNSSRHRLGVQPSGTEQTNFTSTGTTNDPRLIIEHEAPPPPPPDFPPPFVDEFPGPTLDDFWDFTSVPPPFVDDGLTLTDGGFIFHSTPDLANTMAVYQVDGLTLTSEDECLIGQEGPEIFGFSNFDGIFSVHFGPDPESDAAMVDGEINDYSSLRMTFTDTETRFDGYADGIWHRLHTAPVVPPTRISFLIGATSGTVAVERFSYIEWVPHSDGAVGVALAISGTARKISRSSGALALNLAASDDATKTGQTEATIDTELTVDGTTVKTGQTDATIDTELSIDGTTVKTGAVSGTVALTAAVEAAAIATKLTDTTLDLDLSINGSTSKAAQVAAALDLALDLAADTHKATAVAAALGLTLDVAADATKAAQVAAQLGVDLDIAGTAIRHETGHVAGTIALALAIAATAIKHVEATGQAALTLDITGTATKIGRTAGDLGLDLDITGTAHPITADHPTGRLDLLLAIGGTARKSATTIGTLDLLVAIVGRIGTDWTLDPCRILVVESENRVLVVPAEPRVFHVDYEDRTLLVTC